MNKVFLVATAATKLLNFYTWAERDSFDMSLNGYFDKDYCELHLRTPILPLRLILALKPHNQCFLLVIT